MSKVNYAKLATDEDLEMDDRSESSTLHGPDEDAVSILEAKFRRRLRFDVTCLCVLNVVCAQFWSTAIIVAYSVIMGDVRYHNALEGHQAEINALGPFATRPDATVYQPLLFEALFFWIFLAILNIVVMALLYLRANVQVSEIIDKGITLVHRYRNDKDYFLSASSPPIAMSNPDSWNPKTVLTCIWKNWKTSFRLFRAFNLPPLSIYLAVHYVVQGPKLGYLVGYSLCVLLMLAVGTLLLHFGISARGQGLYLVYPSDHASRAKMCHEIWKAMGMDCEKLAKKFEELQ